MSMGKDEVNTTEDDSCCQNNFSKLGQRQINICSRKRSQFLNMLLHLILILCTISTYIESFPSSSTISRIHSNLQEDNIQAKKHVDHSEYRVKRQIDRTWWNGIPLSQTISQMTRQIRDGLQYGWRLSAQIISLYNGIRGIIQLLSPNSAQLKETQDIVDQLRNSTRESVYEYLKMIGLN